MKIFVFGGSGSLGQAIVKAHKDGNEIVVFSRDENKHWLMGLKFPGTNIRYIIGDIRNKTRVTTALVRENPDQIVVASALKHIDRCEYAVEECVSTNFHGLVNVLNAVEEHHRTSLLNLKAVCYVSTDKACSPVNAYGMSKALGERIMVEKSLYLTSVKFVVVRYGNVLNSRGSIIPILHAKGKDPSCKNFTLTHEGMTRFVQTLESSVRLIDHAIEHGESGDIVIPEIKSMRVKDLIEIFSEIYQKPVIVTGLRPGEKLLEALVNETQSMSMVQGDGYHYIKPPYKNLCDTSNARELNSRLNPMNKEDLRAFLSNLGLLEDQSFLG